MAPTAKDSRNPVETCTDSDHNCGGVVHLLPVSEDLVTLSGDDVDVSLGVGPALYGALQQ